MSTAAITTCRHPEADREVRTRTLKGRSVRVELCTRCGREVVHPGDAYRVLGSGPLDAPTLDARSLVLSLFGAQPERPIVNRIVAMKEAFLFEKEVASEAGVNVPDLGFIPYDYGPYSRAVDDVLRNLEEERLLVVERESQGQKEIMQLTERGKSEAERILRRLQRGQVETLRRKRKGWDQLGYFGLLRKVYEEYPAYQAKSKIADEVRPRRRWT